jgi:hypothetical protein
VIITLGNEYMQSIDVLIYRYYGTKQMRHCIFVFCSYMGHGHMERIDVF